MSNLIDYSLKTVIYGATLLLGVSNLFLASCEQTHEKKVGELIEEKTTIYGTNVIVDNNQVNELEKDDANFDSLTLDYLTNASQSANIKGIINRPIHKWEDENLKGRVKMFVEKGDDWTLIKSFDEEGRLLYYHNESNRIPNKLWGRDAYPIGIPICDRKTANMYILDNNFLNPSHITGLREALFVYDTLGNIEAVYDNENILLYEFKYDTHGRLITMLDHGKPKMKVTWDDNRGVNYATFRVKFYSPDGYDGTEFKYGWKSSGVLAKEYPTKGIQDNWHFDYPEYTFYKYPQVRTITDRVGDVVYVDYYIYDDLGRIIHAVNMDNKLFYANGGMQYCLIRYSTYKYNDYGDIIYSSGGSVELPEFSLQTMLNYDYEQLPNAKEYSQWRYVYDDYGNWTRKELYNTIQGDIEIEDLIETITREYNYY